MTVVNWAGFLLLIASCLFFSLVWWRSRLYFASLANLVFASYEGLGPLVLIFPDWAIDSRLTAAIQDYSLSGLADLGLLSVALSGMVICVNATFFAFRSLLLRTPFALGVNNVAANTDAKNSPLDFGMMVSLCSTIFIFGLIAFFDNAGTKRLGDYVGLSEVVTPFYSYGIFLLPAIALALWHAYKNRLYLFVIAGVISCMPLVYEIFISSRRQFLLPIPITLILYWLYLNVKFSTLTRRILIISLSLTILFYMQYSTRLLIQEAREVDLQGSFGTIDGEAFIVELLSPLFGELLAVANISKSVFSTISEGQITSGLQLIVTAFNSVPFLRLGDWIFPGYLDSMMNSIVVFAPYGAFPASAELILSFGTILFPFGGALIGGVMYCGEYWLGRLSVAPSRLTYILFPYFAVLLAKYRSGMSDMIQFTLPHFIILGGVIAVGVVIGRFFPTVQQKQIVLDVRR